MLLYVLESKGSSPGRQGFFMALTSEGKMEGSIGGGIMEHKFVELAKEKLRAEGSEPQAGQLRKQVHDKSAAKNQSGMICSGEQTVLIYPIQHNDAAAIDNIISCLSENMNGTLALTSSGIAFSEAIPGQTFHFSMKDEADWEYTEMLGYRDHLYIVGGGHCALALSRLMSTMDFYIHVFDDRKDLLTVQQNEFVQEKTLVRSYEEVKDLIPVGKHSYVVIMTFGYRTDDIAVRALFERDFRYLGLMGSAAKIERMFADYKKEGIAESILQKIHAPIGINIKSETPEEIAVSIAAEIIRVKNNPSQL